MSGTSASTALPGEPADSAFEIATMRRVTMRLIPLLMMGYFAAYLDRVNVGFAGLTMNQTLGFSASVFGFGSGIFFWGYFFLEIPSNLLLAKVGARRWMARILLSWGLCSALTAFVWSPASFYAIRFLLGMAEAGFYPGVILYVTWWYPTRFRARAVGMFMLAIPVANITGSLISGTLLGLDGTWGLHGWQWLFLLEALPPIILSVLYLRYLTDTPAQASWLTAPQRQWLIRRLEIERAHDGGAKPRFDLAAAFRSPRIWALTAIYFGQNVTGYGLGIFMPQIVAKFGVSVGQVGYIVAIPYVFSAIAMIFFTQFSDRTGSRALTLATACMISGVGLASCTLAQDPVMLMVIIVLAQMGQTSIGPTFWPLPAAMLSGAGAAGGLALINSVGNLGGFLGPYVVGLVKDSTGSLTFGLLVISFGTLIGAGIALVIGHDRRMEYVAKPS